MRGYFRDAAASADAFTDGHLRTGDVGRIDANGFLFVDGRIKEAMVSATGDTVFPEEMEPCYASPLFAERFVVPVPGADGNDVATLVVRPADRTRGDAVYRSEAARLRAAAPARLRYAAFHVLADAPLPRTATGKVRRRALGADIARRRAMREDELIAGLRALVGDVVRRDTSKLGPDDDIVAALVLDSLEALRVLALAEKRYAVQFDDAEVHEIRTLRRLADAVGRRRS
jgi:acyl carrier protein